MNGLLKSRRALYFGLGWSWSYSFHLTRNVLHWVWLVVQVKLHGISFQSGTCWFQPVICMEQEMTWGWVDRCKTEAPHHFLFGAHFCLGFDTWSWSDQKKILDESSGSTDIVFGDLIFIRQVFWFDAEWTRRSYFLSNCHCSVLARYLNFGGYQVKILQNPFNTSPPGGQHFTSYSRLVKCVAVLYEWTVVYYSLATSSGFHSQIFVFP